MILCGFGFIASFSNDKRYENVKKDLEKAKKKGEKVSMDPYLDMLIEKREEMFKKLMTYLLDNGLYEEAKEAVDDVTVRRALYKKYGIAS